MFIIIDNTTGRTVAAWNNYHIAFAQVGQLNTDCGQRRYQMRPLAMLWSV